MPLEILHMKIEPGLNLTLKCDLSGKFPTCRLRPEDGQIGLVWQLDYIDEIVDDAKPDA
jgi:hypothetical protein